MMLYIHEVAWNYQDVPYTLLQHSYNNLMLEESLISILHMPSVVPGKQVNEQTKTFQGM